MLRKRREILRKQQGFTLIEMLVVVILVAILAAIAVPIYTNYSGKAKCTEAMNILGAVAQDAHAFFQRTGDFTGYTVPTNIDAKAQYFTYTWGTNIHSAAGSAGGLTGSDTISVTLNGAGNDTWTDAGACDGTVQ